MTKAIAAQAITTSIVSSLHPFIMSKMSRRTEQICSGASDSKVSLTVRCRQVLISCQAGANAIAGDWNGLQHAQWR